MAPRQTKFNNKWLKSYLWLDSVDGDEYSAYCKLCKKSISVSNKGEMAITDHANGAKHQRLENPTQNTPTLHRFFACKYKVIFIKSVKRV